MEQKRERAPPTTHHRKKKEMHHPNITQKPQPTLNPFGASQFRTGK